MNARRFRQSDERFSQLNVNRLNFLYNLSTVMCLCLSRHPGLMLLLFSILALGSSHRHNHDKFSDINSWKFFLFSFLSGICLIKENLRSASADQCSLCNVMLKLAWCGCLFSIFIWKRNRIIRIMSHQLGGGGWWVLIIIRLKSSSMAVASQLSYFFYSD